MKYNDEFSPENVEEQIDQFTYSLPQEPLPSSAQVIQELHVYYKEDQRSVERMWERLVPYVAEHKSTMLPVSDQPEAANKIFAERIRPKKPGRHSSRKKFAPQFALIAAIFCTSLVVGSLLFVFQMVHFTHTGSPPSSSASSHGLYISRQGEVSRIDLQTRKTVWRTIVPKSGIDTGNLSVLNDTVYLRLPRQLYALNTSNGHIRWANKDFNAFPMAVVDGLLYAETVLDANNALYALNPADGKIKATYIPPHSQAWNSPTIANGILYYGTGSNLYAVALANQQIVWHQDLSSPTPEISLVERIQVKNDVVYAQVQMMRTLTGAHELVVAFDARTGKKLWGPKTDAHILAITDTAIYATTGTDLTPSAQFDAYDAHTGTLLWHQAINPSKTQTTSEWHSIIKMLVDSDTLYISYDSRSSAGGIAALNARDGTLLWQANVNDQEADSPLSIHDKVLYTVSNNSNNGAIDAFKTSDGSELWHMTLNGSATQWQADIA